MNDGSVVFLAKETACMLMEGDSLTVHGVYASFKGALAALKANAFHFDDAEKRDEGRWCYVFDGEMTLIYEIERVEVLP